MYVSYTSKTSIHIVGTERVNTYQSGGTCLPGVASVDDLVPDVRVSREIGHCGNAGR